MATVWEATHGPLALRVAVKVLRHDLARDAVARQRFLREAAAAARVRRALFVRASIWRAELIDYDKIPCNFHG
jgi:hypothetical protein